MEGDFLWCSLSISRDGFQSTPSAWRETNSEFKAATAGMEISIHSLRMEGDQRFPFLTIYAKHISIHSLRMEGDT